MGILLHADRMKSTRQAQGPYQLLPAQPSEPKRDKHKRPSTKRNKEKQRRRRRSRSRRSGCRPAGGGPRLRGGGGSAPASGHFGRLRGFGAGVFGFEGFKGSVGFKGFKGSKGFEGFQGCKGIRGLGFGVYRCRQEHAAPGISLRVWRLQRSLQFALHTTPANVNSSWARILYIGPRLSCHQPRQGPSLQTIF